ncbi:MAG: low temperature requirement protein A, partial [Pseudomonadota bacterium]|nr:low temperature requirement protein A [Pseudomonadota bacterium]
PTAIIAFAGPSLFLLGCTIFHRVTAERLRASYLLAVAALAVWGWLALSLHLNGMWLGAGVLLIMVTMAVLGHRKAA